jgi:hypothetical protein
MGNEASTEYLVHCQESQALSGHLFLDLVKVRYSSFHI